MGSINVLCVSGDWGISGVLSFPGIYIILTSLFLKLGLTPFHLWFPEVIQGVGYLQGFIISTWQKVSPLYLLLMVRGELNRELLLLVGSLSVLVGG